jgi:hypothetical protein
LRTAARLEPHGGADHDHAGDGDGKDETAQAQAGLPGRGGGKELTYRFDHRSAQPDDEGLQHKQDCSDARDPGNGGMGRPAFIRPDAKCGERRHRKHRW